MKPRAAHKVLSYLGFPLFILGALVVVWIFRTQLYQIFASPARLRHWVSGWGYVAPLVFIALQFIQVVLFIIPGEVAQAAGGYIFGMWAGILYSVIGILLGSIFNFFLARLLGVPFVKAIFGTERLTRFDSVLTSSRATVAFFLLFLIPGIPKDALCYVAGLSTIRFTVFMVVSTVGRLPGIAGSSALGGAAASQKWVTVATIGIAALVFFAIGVFYRERFHLFVERVLARKGAEWPDEVRRDSGSQSETPAGSETNDTTRGGPSRARDADLDENRQGKT